jgi:hypothetical protein
MVAHLILAFSAGSWPLHASAWSSRAGDRPSDTGLHQLSMYCVYVIVFIFPFFFFFCISGHLIFCTPFVFPVIVALQLVLGSYGFCTPL